MSHSLVVAIVLLLAIVAFEGRRRWTHKPIGLLSVAHLVFVLNYCIPPLFIALIGGTSLETDPYGVRLFLFSVVEQVQLGAGAFATGSWLALLAYCAMIAGYMLIKVKVGSRMVALDSAGVPLRGLGLAGVALGVVTVAALLLYSPQFKSFLHMVSTDPNRAWYASDPTGLLMMFKMGVLVRGGEVSISRGFLQIIVLLGVPAVMFLSASAARAQGPVRWALAVGMGLVWLAVLARVYHASGRMEFAAFIVLFPLAALLSLRSIKVAMIGLVPVLLFGLFIGVADNAFFSTPGASAGLMGEALFFKSGQSILFMLNEFSFPYVISAHTAHVVPELVAYRHFIDLPLAALYMLPSIGGADTWPPMISHIHLEMLPYMPIDLVSFGYYSWGAVGVALVFLVFGSALAVFDLWLVPGAGWLAQCLRAGWMMYLPLRIMYADPYTSMKTGFGLIVGTVIVVALVWLTQRRNRARWELPS
ncbi:hypothetical protein ACFL12_06780 [Pseudomonadota bacterium]